MATLGFSDLPGFQCKDQKLSLCDECSFASKKHLIDALRGEITWLNLESTESVDEEMPTVFTLSRI